MNKMLQHLDITVHVQGQNKINNLSNKWVRSKCGQPGLRIDKGKEMSGRGRKVFSTLHSGTHKKVLQVFFNLQRTFHTFNNGYPNS